MAYELDHIFVLTRVGVPPCARLTALGLVEGEPNVHPGQGTANRRFFFANAMLELLWVHDSSEARRPPADRLRLWERSEALGAAASPFGVCLRSSPGGEESPPFAAWDYRPAYLPPPLAIHVTERSTAIHEPLLFFAGFAGGPPKTSRPSNPQTITAIRIISPHPAASEAMQAVASVAPVSFLSGDAHLMDVAFDGESAGSSHDLRPALPLRICY